MKSHGFFVILQENYAMSSIYKYNVGRISPDHYHLYRVSQNSMTDEFGEECYEAKEYCISIDGVRITECKMPHSQVSQILSDSKAISDDFESVLDSTISEVFNNIHRIGLLVAEDSNGDCLKIEVRTNKAKNFGMYQYEYFSQAGFEIIIEVDYYRILRLKRDNISLGMSVEQEEDIMNIPPEMTANRISKSSFDILYSYCISSLNHLVDLMRFTYEIS